MYTCFTCKVRPSGNSLAGPHSAFCEDCQPWKPDPRMGKGLGAAKCHNCNEVFTTDGNFDRHQRMRDGESVCLRPEAVGLELKDSGRWGLPG